MESRKIVVYGPMGLLKEKKVLQMSLWCANWCSRNINCNRLMNFLAFNLMASMIFQGLNNIGTSHNPFCFFSKNSMYRGHVISCFVDFFIASVVQIKKIRIQREWKNLFRFDAMRNMNSRKVILWSVCLLWKGLWKVFSDCKL